MQRENDDACGFGVETKVHSSNFSALGGVALRLAASCCLLLLLLLLQRTSSPAALLFVFSTS